MKEEKLAREDKLLKRKMHYSKRLNIMAKRKLHELLEIQSSKEAVQS